VNRTQIFHFAKFFLREFQPITFALDNNYYQIKTLIGFWCRRELNTRSLIQSSEILLVKSIGAYSFYNLGGG